MCSTCFGHYYIHHQELATILLNYHIGRIVLGSMCVGVLVWLVWSGILVLQTEAQLRDTVFYYIQYTPIIIYLKIRFILSPINIKTANSLHVILH